jgi:hypothetical protein
MLILAGVAVLTVAVALHVAWIAKRAVARGRSALAWVALGLVLGAAGLRGGIALMMIAANLDNNGLMALLATAPFTLTLAPMIVIVLVLNRLDVHVAPATSWPVFAHGNGAGTLVVEDDAIELRWAARTDRLARAGLSATADQESLRLAWPDRELLVMPTGKPATREGRVRQARAIAERLRR